MLLKNRFHLILILLSVVLIGSFGYMLIEGWSFFDSFYMTIITLTTIGYQELRPLSFERRVFNVFMIITGVGTVTYSIGAIISDVTSIDFEKKRRLKMIKKIEGFENHTIVCGYGRMGEVICNKLSRHNNLFVVIEKRPALIDELKKTNYFYLEGDAANDDCLVQAGIKRAKVLVSVIDNDSDGLYVALAGRSMNEKLFIIVRANEEKAKIRILSAGANKVILPYIMSGQKVAETVLNPATEDLFDITDDSQIAEENKILLADLIIKQESLLNGKSLEEMGERLKNLIVIGIKNKNHDFIFKPSSDHIFKQGDCLIAMGPKKDYEAAKESLLLG